MKKLNRLDKIQEIYKIAKENTLNVSTLVFLLATMSDKGVTKFHKELLEKYPKKVA